jgi:hypothetical protein
MTFGIDSVFGQGFAHVHPKVREQPGQNKNMTVLISVLVSASKLEEKRRRKTHVFSRVIFSISVHASAGLSCLAVPISLDQYRRQERFDQVVCLSLGERS